MCLDQGVGIIPYFPLAGGILTGKYSLENRAPEQSRADTDPNFSRFVIDRNIRLGQEVGRLAADLELAPSGLSLAWLMGRPAVSTVIVGATRTSQLEDNLRSVEMTLSEETIQELDRISEPFRNGEPFATYRLS